MSTILRVYAGEVEALLGELDPRDRAVILSGIRSFVVQEQDQAWVRINALLEFRRQCEEAVASPFFRLLPEEHQRSLQQPGYCSGQRTAIARIGYMQADRLSSKALQVLDQVEALRGNLATTSYLAILQVLRTGSTSKRRALIKRWRSDLHERVRNYR